MVSATGGSRVKGGGIKTLEIVYFHVILDSFVVRLLFCFFGGFFG